MSKQKNAVSQESEEVTQNQDAEMSVPEAAVTPELVGKVTGPATEAVSEPVQATQPATNTLKPVPMVVQSTVMAKKDPFNIPNDPETFSALGKERQAEMVKLVPCHFIQDLQGCIGLSVRFKYTKNEVVSLPYWFALSYPNHIIVRG